MSTGPTIDHLRLALAQHASVADRDAVSTPRERALTVTRRARVARRRRVGAIGALTVAATAAVAAVVLQGGVPGPAVDRGVAPAATPGPALPGSGGVHAGYRYPATLTVSGRTYQLGEAYDAAPGSRWIRIEAEASRSRRAMAWSTSSGTRGSVTVAVDGAVISRSTAGALESGAVLSPGRPHVVTIRANGLRAHQRLALVLYDDVGR